MLIGRLLASDVLEVLPTKLTDSPFVSGDVVNTRLGPSDVDDQPW